MTVKNGSLLNIKNFISLLRIQIKLHFGWRTRISVIRSKEKTEILRYNERT